ncbi:MAG: phosphatase PAP2 family protein [Rhizobiaceae bacterium]|nr:phosphatase PAP2 family protein [Rhizobiaceae bacterium]
MAYLSSERRLQVLMADISPNFKVVAAGRSVRLLFGTSVICEITPPDQAFLRDQLRYMRNYADLRADRLAEIMVQAEGVLAFFGAQHQLNTTRRQRTLELLTVTQALTINLEMMVKHLCWLPRPLDLSPNVQPMVQTPDHSTFPSGHATEAFAIATVFHRLTTGESIVEGMRHRSLPIRLAHRIATNRTIAGLHFPVDSAAGAMLGCAIGEALHALCSGQPSTRFAYGDADFNLNSRSGDGVSQDFTLHGLKDYGDTLSKSPAEAPAGAKPAAEIFAAFWRDAVEEFAAPETAPGRE